jgi:acetolactate synthase-1/2/3 large subunit
MATTGGAIMAEMLKAEGVNTIFGIIDGTYTQFFWNCVQNLGIEAHHSASRDHCRCTWQAPMPGSPAAWEFAWPPMDRAWPTCCPAWRWSREKATGFCSSPARGAVASAIPTGAGSYQCFDQVGVIRPMAKWSETAESAGRIPELMRQALRKCWEGRPGVVHLDVPENVINGEAKPTAIQKPPAQYRSTKPMVARQDQVEAAAQMLTKASFPIIHCGSGVIHAAAYMSWPGWPRCCMRRSALPGAPAACCPRPILWPGPWCTSRR